MADRNYPKTVRGEFEKLLKQFVEIPTVSSNPEHKRDIERCAELAASTLERFGGKAKIYETPGHPVVHGVFGDDPDLPTVTIYNHLDVQPASRETEPWTTDPFIMEIDGDTYRGRGTTDDKGPALSALYAVRAAREAGTPLNIRMLWEFEEEVGSGNFEGVLKANRHEMATDSVLVSDTIWVSRQQPACPAGLRGLLGILLSLETGETDQHSGVTGGAARNPIGELMKLVSEMYDAGTGKVKIKGFYDDVEMPTKKEIQEFSKSGFSVRKFKKDHLFKSLRTEDPVELMKRIWTLPTMEVHGLVGGYTGPGVKTIIPPRAEVKMTCRLVPNQTPDSMARLIKDFVKSKNPDVRVEMRERMFPFKSPTEGPFADAIREAMRFSFGKEPVFVREGGSIGAVTSMEKVLKCPVMFLGLSLPEHGYHAPNENYDWQQASGGMVAIHRYLELVANL
jgi:acetylornithine deacetylase/succinyl-diaminopimelate desuccinylase-like protein